MATVHCVEVCSGQEGHTPTPKNISCVFKGQEDQWMRVAGLLDSGNLIPGSAAMSTEFADQIGVRWEPYRPGGQPKGGGADTHPSDDSIP
ncbi:MAG: hypothetical protein GY696_39605 [Gammaproteobacteria bacterium]|nr:hypothetical protein [Gammaproteobacteria bacterium]